MNQNVVLKHPNECNCSKTHRPTIDSVHRCVTCMRTLYVFNHSLCPNQDLGPRMTWSSLNLTVNEPVQFSNVILIRNGAVKTELMTYKKVLVLPSAIDYVLQCPS
jgi:hypothetical protein